jgi:hypothetical protein
LGLSRLRGRCNCLDQCRFPKLAWPHLSEP